MSDGELTRLEVLRDLDQHRLTTTAAAPLLGLEFVESGSTFAYFHATRAYLEAWGKPSAFYSDKHGVFRVNHPGALSPATLYRYIPAARSANTPGV